MKSESNAKAYDTPTPRQIGHSEKVRPQGETPRHRVHSEHLMGLLLSARGKYQLGPDLLPIDSPLAWYLPAEEHETLAIYGNTHGWWVSFDWPGLKVTPLDGYLSIQWRGKTQQLPRYKFIDAVSIAAMVGLFRKLSNSMVRQDLAGTSSAMALMVELFSLYLDLPEGSHASAGHRALERFHDRLVEQLYDDLSIEQLAAEVDMSANHLRDLFLKRYGMGPLAYRTYLRLDRARELLLSSNMSIKQVAHQVGYPDALYFSRIFRKHFSLSPSQLIRRYRLHIE